MNKMGCLFRQPIFCQFAISRGSSVEMTRWRKIQRILAHPSQSKSPLLHSIKK